VASNVELEFYFTLFFQEVMKRVVNNDINCDGIPVNNCCGGAKVFWHV